MSAKTIHFIRHAQSEHNARVIGALDEDVIRMDPALRDARLTALGHRQAHALDSELAALREIELVVTSPLTRAIQTTLAAFADHPAPRTVQPLHREHLDSFCDVGRSPTELTESFRTQGLKVTPQRQLLFRLLHGNDQHPTADALFARASADMPGISLRTVYQTLSDLASMGELRPVTFGAGPARFDPNVDDHQHLVCTACGSVRDVYVEGADDLRVEGLGDFELGSASIVFHGTCADCTHP